MASTHSLADVFAEPSGLPPDRNIKHVIPLEPDAQPPFMHMYRLSPSELLIIELKRQVTELLQKQLIDPSKASSDRSVSPYAFPYGAPLLCVLKKRGELCMVLDYRALNKLTN